MSKRSKKKKQRTTRGSPSWMVAGCIGKASKSDFQNWRDRGFYNSAAASEVRRIDPKSGEVVVSKVLEDIATDILKTDKMVVKSAPRRSKRKARHGTTDNHAPSQEQKDAFYKSWEWRKLRMQALKLHGRTCQCCGAAAGDRDVSGKLVRIVVDHIKPISKFWNMRFQRQNLQVLCDECNQGKGNWDQTDFRPISGPDEWITEERGIDPAILEQLSIRGETIQ